MTMKMMNLVLDMLLWRFILVITEWVEKTLDPVEVSLSGVKEMRGGATDIRDVTGGRDHHLLS
jgi:hypothetical protein